MEAMNYEQQSLMGATGIELIVALYDGAIRQLHRAIQAVREDDTVGRRIAVKKVVDILMYLQARLRPDVGGTAASSLSDFYAAMFTLTLEASHIASIEGFEEVIRCLRNVRDAWAIAAKDPAVGKVLPRELRTREERYVAPALAARADQGEVMAQRWSA
jgi:flagellar protein FliS